MIDTRPPQPTVTDMTSMLTPTRPAKRGALAPAHLSRARRARAGGRKRRAAELIEFVLLMPIFLYMIIFAIDMGQMVMLSGIVHDAAFVGAQAGAQEGGGAQGDQAAVRAARNDLALVPTVNASRVSARIYNGYGVCNSTGSARGSYIELRVSYPAQFLTPGLSALMSIMDPRGNNQAGTWSLSAIGVARCEIARS